MLPKTYILICAEFEDSYSGILHVKAENIYIVEAENEADARRKVKSLEVLTDFALTNSMVYRLIETFEGVKLIR